MIIPIFNTDEPARRPSLADEWESYVVVLNLFREKDGTFASDLEINALKKKAQMKLMATLLRSRWVLQAQTLGVMGALLPDRCVYATPRLDVVDEADIEKSKHAMDFTAIVPSPPAGEAENHHDHRPGRRSPQASG